MDLSSAYSAVESVDSSENSEFDVMREPEIIDTMREPEILPRRVDEWTQINPTGEKPRMDLLPNHAAPATTEGRESAGLPLSQNLIFPSTIEQWPQSSTLYPLQEWEGYVIEIGKNDFIARLLDLTAGSSFEEEEATIPFSEIADEDMRTMQEGSFFRWVIGYERSPAGTKKRVSQIVFRDLPTVTESDLREARSWARKMARVLNP